MNCRHCQQPLGQPFLDLGFAPPSNAYLSAAQLSKPEVTYPLRVYVCESCWLAQAPEYAHPEVLFGTDYAYFSSVSSTWLNHARRYVEMITARLELSTDSLVIEIAANDGYLLQYFMGRGIPCLGIEPTASTAQAARAKGIPILQDFFGRMLGSVLVSENRQANLIIGNNVLAHVPDINDFVAGLKLALKPGGTITLEFPHLLRLFQENQFDTVYHEHYSYLSLYVVIQIFSAQELTIFDVEELPTHGGSLRVYVGHIDSGYSMTERVKIILQAEENYGLRSLATYHEFQARTDRVKNGLLEFLLEQKRLNRMVVGYGAAAKGNTLLNYAGIKPDLLPWVVDAAPSKQGRYLPGSHIPVLKPAIIMSERPDYILVFPWNLREEIMTKMNLAGSWGGRFVTAVPELKIWD